jgi:CheY-like chemotaxis protein
MLKKVTDFIAFRIEEQKQKFSVNIDERIPSIIETDDQRLAQVLMNLLGNATKFTPEGGEIGLNTELITEIDNECTIQFSVTDTGIGMSPEQTDRLFQSFEQADSSTARKFGGNGLGLAISKRIVEMMGGRIWVKSELDQGSAFFFEITVKRLSAENARELRRDLTLENVRLLVIDDSEEVLEYFAHITNRLNIACDIAKSGAIACELIEKKGAYDICFLDWNMPEMNGVELARRIKGYSDQTVCVMMSAYDLQNIESEARKSGVDSFLPKPLYSSNIVDCLNRYVGIPGGVDKKQVLLENIFAGVHILLAEDVKINREIVKAQLAITNIDIDYAENGKEAVRMFADHPDKYEMIFMDMQMPEMDGLEATRLIRALSMPEARTVPIVAMTANVFREDIESCLAAGMNDHVGKPLDLAVVIAKIKQYAQRQ